MIVEIIFIALILVGIALALGLLWCGFVGAVAQFAWASDVGFVGVIIFFAAWFFMFPIMAIWAVLWGFLILMDWI